MDGSSLADMLSHSKSPSRSSPIFTCTTVLRRTYDFPSSSFSLGCTLPQVTLSADNPSMLAPSTARRSQLFSISSSVHINCSTSPATVKQWTVFKCSSECSTPVLIQGSMTSGELFIPRDSLDYGVYQIKLTVAMTLSSQLVSSAVTYLMIIPSPVTVNLLQLGSSMITHGQQQTLSLDPGSYSIDPDSTLFNASVCHSSLSG